MQNENSLGMYRQTKAVFYKEKILIISESAVEGLNCPENQGAYKTCCRDG